MQSVPRMPQTVEACGTTLQCVIRMLMKMASSVDAAALCLDGRQISQFYAYLTARNNASCILLLFYYVVG